MSTADVHPMVSAMFERFQADEAKREAELAAQRADLIRAVAEHIKRVTDAPKSKSTLDAHLAAHRAVFLSSLNIIRELKPGRAFKMAVTEQPDPKGKARYFCPPGNTCILLHDGVQVYPKTYTAPITFQRFLQATRPRAFVPKDPYAVTETVYRKALGRTSKLIVVLATDTSGAIADMYGRCFDVKTGLFRGC